MRYELDVNGYVISVFWGCHSGNCQEYTGTVPLGYSNLIEWSENAYINAYYIDNEGNLILDTERELELQENEKIELIDNTPILAKDLYGSNEILDSQYEKQTATGTILKLSNVKNIAPKVKITGIDYLEYEDLKIYSQSYNMLKNDGKTETINGVDFTRLADGSIKIKGTATANIEYNLSGSSTNAIPIFVLKKDISYYLNIGGFSCEMKYHDGETTAQVYTGASGVIKLSENKEVTQTILKIAKGKNVDTVIKPMLNYGTTALEYEEYKSKVLDINFGEPFSSDVLFPSDDLYPSDDLFPSGIEYVTDYILIENGKIYVSRNNEVRILTAGNVQLFTGNNTLYADKDVDIEISYSIDVLSSEERINAKIEKTAEGINLEVSKKVGNDEIISKINQTAEEITIDASKLNINGVISANGNFSVDIDGNMVCSNGQFNGGKINLVSNKNNPSFNVIGDDGSSGYFSSRALAIIDSSSSHIPAQLMISVYEDGVPTIDLLSEDLESSTIIRSTEIITPTLTQTSLAECKKNFEKLDNGLDIINDIDIYKYNLKNEEDTTKKHIGFIIGNNYNYSEEVTSKNNDGVDIYSFVAVCCKAIQEQQKQIETLQQEIDKLKGGN